MDSAASFIGQKEVHGAHYIEAAGSPSVGPRIAEICGNRPGAVHRLLSVLLENHFCKMPSNLIVIHILQRLASLPDALLISFHQSCVFPTVTRRTI